MLPVYVEGISVFGPGLNGWDASAPVLAGREPYTPSKLQLPVLEMLPPAERRRTTPTIKLALSAAHAAVTLAGRAPAEVATVFASSGGDGETIHIILETLATENRELSPTRFHNSVHNAPSGYWAVAMGCREPSTTLCAHDWSFAAALLEAAAQTVVDRRVVALIAYDCPYPEPLHSVRPIEAEFGVALVLSVEQTGRSIARLDLGSAATVETGMSTAALEKLRIGNPAARALPLLQALAGKRAETIILGYSARAALSVGVHPVRARVGSVE